MIGIIDYGMGNLRSVQKAFESVGAQAVILAEADDLRSRGVTKLILPGVGAFADGMEQLRTRGWIEPVKTFIASGRPFLGICLGMQLLFEGSEEDAASPDQPVPGLAVIPGQAVRFRSPAPDGSRLKVPHMGWNTLRWSRPDPLLAGLDQDAAVYFVHSYYCRPDPARAGDCVSASTDYGVRFCSTLWRDNVWATQFHPEKSQRIGLRMLANFAGVTR